MRRSVATVSMSCALRQKLEAITGSLPRRKNNPVVKVSVAEPIGSA